MQPDRAEQFLLTRNQAAERYNISLRTLEKLYRRHPDFPIIRLDGKILIHRELADQFFVDYIGGKININ